MSHGPADPWDSGAAWSEARERARDEVRQALAGRGERPGPAQEPGMSPRTKRLLVLAAACMLVLLAVLGVLLIPGIQSTKHRELSAEQRAARAAAARERVRIAAEQRPRSASAPGSHAALRRLPVARLRDVLRSDLEASITADARARVARHLL